MADTIDQKLPENNEEKEVSSVEAPVTPTAPTVEPKEDPSHIPSIAELAADVDFDDLTTLDPIAYPEKNLETMAEKLAAEKIAEKEAQFKKEVDDIKLAAAIHGIIPQNYAEFAKFEAQKYMKEGQDPVTAAQSVYEANKQLFQAANAIAGNKADGVWPKMPPQFESPIDTKNNKEHSEKQAIIDSMFQGPWKK